MGGNVDASKFVQYFGWPDVEDALREKFEKYNGSGTFEAKFV